MRTTYMDGLSDKHCLHTTLGGYQTLSSLRVKIYLSYFRKNKDRYILQVHVDYSQELHNIQNESPYMINKVKINKVDKLMPNFNNH